MSGSREQGSDVPSADGVPDDAADDPGRADPDDVESTVTVPIARNPLRGTGIRLTDIQRAAASMPRPEVLDAARRAAEQARLSMSAVEALRDAMAPLAWDLMAGFREQLLLTSPLRMLEAQRAEMVRLATAPLLRDALRVADVMSQQVRIATGPTVGSALAEQFRLADRLTVPALLGLELEVTAGLARRALGDSGLASWRIAMQAVARVETAGRIASAIDTGDLAQLAGSARYAEQLAAHVAELDPTSRLLGPVSGPALRAWNRSVAARPTPRRILVSAAAGQNVTAVMSGEVLTNGVDEHDSTSIVTNARSYVVEPWRDGPANASRALHARLERIDPAVAELLDGGWDDVERNGPAAISKITNCAVEALDRTLRALAGDDDAVLAWHTTNKRPASELYQGKPTRALRVRYALRERPGEVRLTQAQVESCVTLATAMIGPLQQGKHSAGTTIVMAQALLVSVESTLHLLTLHE
ncbi:MAG TPA: hypothetical protein VNQ77_11595 [Frankiaceae bacterium]|nr:hypothetical protein [Frankiaceae bacterium]